MSTFGNAAILNPEHRWECPNCTKQSVTRRADRHTQMHICAGQNGLMSPMVPAGTRCKVSRVEREDYVGRELVRTDQDGRPAMGVAIERDTGKDFTVFAPTATGGSRASGSG